MASKHEVTETDKGWTCSCGACATGLSRDGARIGAESHRTHPNDPGAAASQVRAAALRRVAR